MRHGVLGPGGIGGLVGGAFARRGDHVWLLMRPATLAAYSGTLRVESRVLGEFDVQVPGVSELPDNVDVLWITVKSNQLEDALAMAPPGRLGDAMVVPLMNGLDHVQRLRQVYGDTVVPGAIRGESERVDVGHIVQATPFAATELAPPPHLLARTEALARDMNAAGLSCAVRPGEEAGVLWGKLAILCPLALATTSLAAPLGAVRADEAIARLMFECLAEVCAVAGKDGCTLDQEKYRALLQGMPDEMRSSMQKDLSAGRPLELDHISGPVLRRGSAGGVPTPATTELDARVRAAVASSGS